MLVCLIASENLLAGDSSDDDRSDEDKERPRLPRLRIAELCLRTHSETEPKRALQSAPRAKELRSATAFRVQLTFLNACCSERALKAQNAAVELALPAAAAARAKER